MANPHLTRQRVDPFDSRLDLAERVEEVVHRSLTTELFSGEDDAFRYGGESMLARQIAEIPSTQLPGLKHPAPAPGWVQASIARRSAPLRAFLDRVTTTELVTGTRPWVPVLEPPEPAPPQGGEKTQLWSRAISVQGGEVLPTLVGSVANVSAQVIQQGAGDVVNLLIAEDTLLGVVDYVVGQLVSVAGAAVADVAAGVAQVESAGWTPDLLAGPSSSLLGEDLQRLGLAGVTVAGGVPSADGLLVISTAGLWCAVRLGGQQLAEPRLGGFEISTLADVVCEPAPGSVALVAPGP